MGSAGADEGEAQYLRGLLDHLHEHATERRPLALMLLDWRLVFLASFVAVESYMLSLIFAENEAPLKALSTIAAAAAFLVAYWQWKLAREEASFEKYYDRMNTTIDFVDKCGLEEAGDSREARLSHVRNMRVFNQLDNLEYVLGKYRLGYISTDIVYRAVRNFKTECAQDWFRTKTLEWLNQIEAYTRDTKCAARYIVDESSA
jgi:hypothetical protein